MSSASTVRREDLERDKAFERRPRPLSQGPAKSFSAPRVVVVPGRKVGSTVSADEILGAGVLVRIPPALRSYTDGQDEVVLEARDLERVLDVLESTFPGIRARVLDEAGGRRPYVNLFVNEELVGSALGEIALKPGDVVHILPSVAGG